MRMKILVVGYILFVFLLAVSVKADPVVVTALESTQNDIFLKNSGQKSFSYR